MNIFDFVIIIILGIFIFNGFRKGFLREIAGLVGIIIAFILAVRLMDDFSVIMSHYVGLSPRVAVIVTAVVIFILVVVLFILTAKILRKLMELATLGWIDRLLGSSLGLLKGVIIVSVLALILSLLPAGQNFSRKQNESFLFNPMKKAAPFIFNGFMKILPVANDFYDELKESLADRSGAISRDALDWLDSFRKKKDDLKNTLKEREIIYNGLLININTALSTQRF